MKNKKKILREILYWFVRVESIALLILAIIGFAKDDATIKESRFVFTIIQAVLLGLLTFVPYLFKKVFKIQIPIVLEILYLMFCAATIMLGEIFEFYIKYKWWDDFLHIFSGSFISVIGFVVLFYFNEKKNIKFDLSPGFIIFFCLCFSLSAEFLWEVIEWTLDSIVGSNMQRYMHDITLEPFVGRAALEDTMWDMIEALVGSVILNLFAYLDLISKNSSLKKLMEGQNIQEEIK